jgi:hypothetical protein
MAGALFAMKSHASRFRRVPPHPVCCHLSLPVYPSVPPHVDISPFVKTKCTYRWPRRGFRYSRLVRPDPITWPTLDSVQLVPSFAPQDDIPALSCARPLWLAWSQRPVPLSPSVHPAWSRLDCPQRPGRPLAVLRNISRCPQDPTPTRGRQHAGGGPNPHQGADAELTQRVPV